jgi:hypothetical protein
MSNNENDENEQSDESDESDNESDESEQNEDEIYARELQLQELREYNPIITILNYLENLEENDINIDFLLRHVNMIDNDLDSYESLIAMCDMVGDAEEERGASIDDINKLKTFEYKGNLKLVNDNNTCNICLEDYIDNDNIKSLPCDHIFHISCIDHWLKINKVCPVCKWRITDEHPKHIKNEIEIKKSIKDKINMYKNKK